MKRLFLFLAIISLDGFAADRNTPCNGNSCKVKIVTKDSGGNNVTSAEFNSAGISLSDVNLFLSKSTYGSSYIQISEPLGISRVYSHYTSAVTTTPQVVLTVPSVRNTGKGSVGLCDASTTGQYYAEFYWSCDGSTCTGGVSELVGATTADITWSGGQLSISGATSSRNEFCFAVTVVGSSLEYAQLTWNL